MKYFSWLIIAVVAVAIVTGFFIVGTPREERMRRFDEQRVGNLQQLQSEIINFWQAKQRLPATLVELEDPTRGVMIPTDPETGAGYEYSVKATDTFELCASFALPRLHDQVAARYPKSIPVPAYGPEGGPPGFFGPEAWNHGAGRACFERTIDPDFFPPVKSR